METRKVLELNNHIVYYVKTDKSNYYINIPKNTNNTLLSIELKSKMSNYNLDTNDEIWVMENVKSTYSHIDNYNFTLVLPIMNDEDISILEKMDEDKFKLVDNILSDVINNAYLNLKENNVTIDKQIILVNNDRYKVFINWFMAKYTNRVILKNMLELIQLYNVTATSYKTFDTPQISFVVGSYDTEVNAPKSVKEEEPVVPEKLVPAHSSGFTSYWLLAIITLVVSAVIIYMTFIAK